MEVSSDTEKYKYIQNGTYLQGFMFSFLTRLYEFWLLLVFFDRFTCFERSNVQLTIISCSKIFELMLTHFLLHEAT